MLKTPFRAAAWIGMVKFWHCFAEATAARAEIAAIVLFMMTTGMKVTLEARWEA